VRGAGGRPPRGQARGGPAGAPVAGPGERSVADVQVEKTFGPRQGLHYTVQVYTPAGAAVPLVRLQAQLWRQGTLLGVTPARELGEAPEGRKWSERIGLEAFPPGDYELRVLASDPATGATAERHVAFRVES